MHSQICVANQHTKLKGVGLEDLCSQGEHSMIYSMISVNIHSNQLKCFDF